MILPPLHNLTQHLVDISLPSVNAQAYFESHCQDLGHCRTTWDIIRSCLAVIFVCAWVTLHPNIPEPRNRRNDAKDPWYTRFDRWFKFRLKRAGVGVVALVAPEFILAWAIRQRVVAGIVAKQLQVAAENPTAIRARDARANAAKKVTAVMDLVLAKAAEAEVVEAGEYVMEAVKEADVIVEVVNEAEEVKEAESKALAEGHKSDMELKVTIKDNEESGWASRTIKSMRAALMYWGILVRKIEPDTPGESAAVICVQCVDFLRTEWTVTHGFFVIMGGFHEFNGDTPGHPLSRHEVISLVASGALVLPSESEIDDKSKRDALSKILLLVQILWFVVQCLARWHQDLPITGLEIATMAYTTLTLCVNVAWWDKPLGAEEPVRVPTNTVRPNFHHPQLQWRSIRDIIGNFGRIVIEGKAIYRYRGSS